MGQPQLKSNEEWAAWGDEDPMYGVASWKERRKGGENPWTDAEFYENGRSDWQFFWSFWKANRNVKTDTVLEIGAGAGRMTFPISGHFDEVKALDVSPGMLDFARDHCPATNIDWLLTDGLTFPVPDNSVDAVFSSHVFQHFNDWNAVATNLKECARVLKSGGSLCIHMHIHSFPEANRLYSRAARKMYSAFLKLQSIKAERKRKAMRNKKAEPYMHGLSIDRDKLLQFLGEIGLQNPVIATITPPDARGNPHTVLLASK